MGKLCLATVAKHRPLEGLTVNAGRLATLAIVNLPPWDIVAKMPKHKWTFKARFRRGAYGWRSQPAMSRIKEAVAEIKGVRRKHPPLAADGAVAFLERLSPALEGVDSSSGAIGTAVNRAIDQLVPLIAEVEVDAATRRCWLQRLFKAVQDDEIPYIERLTTLWGDLCASKEIASEQADLLMAPTISALLSDSKPSAYFAGSSACLSALFRAERYQEVVAVAGDTVYGGYAIWAVRALAALGRGAEALRLAETVRERSFPDFDLDGVCENILLSSGMVEDAYQRYGLAVRGTTNLSTFRAIAKRYPNKKAETILKDLAARTPGEEGKWFAAAKSAGLFEVAIELAKRSPCDPRTLTRAARDFAEKQPQFALYAGLLALSWLVVGFGYEITSVDVSAAYDRTMEIAIREGLADQVTHQIRAMIRPEASPDPFVSEILKQRLER